MAHTPRGEFLISNSAEMTRSLFRMSYQLNADITFGDESFMAISGNQCDMLATDNNTSYLPGVCDP